MSDMNPTKRKLRGRPGGGSYATFMHPNPKLYKYLWRVFSNDSEYEGADFFLLVPELSTAVCFAKLRELELMGAPYFLYNRRIPRRFDGMPFDPQSERWRDTEWALSWEADNDANHEGFK